jgi:single-stranded DNA-binding protein
MTTMKLSVVGQIKKVDIRDAAGKTLAEVSLCKKVKGRNGAEDQYTWIRATIWSVPDWMQAKLVKDAFIGLTGDFELRSYEKDGVKRQSAEVRCQSFDVEIAGDAEPQQAAPPAARGPRPAAPLDDEPPF